MKNSGFTLIELAVTLALVALALGLAAPFGARTVDRLAAIAARDQVMALVHQTRLHARLYGGAHLLILPDSVIEVWAGDSIRGRWSGIGNKVSIDPGRPDSVALVWDALGVGRVANRTLTFERGDAETALVISSAGRARRR